MKVAKEALVKPSCRRSLSRHVVSRGSASNALNFLDSGLRRNDDRGLNQSLPSYRQLVFLGITLEIILLGMLYLGNLRLAVPFFLLLYFFAFLVYLAAIPTIRSEDMALRNHIPLLLGFAFLFRFTLLFSEPGLSDDVYRYVWDGKILNEGINPYRFAPDAEELSPFRDELYGGINHKDIGTPYGPLMIGVFALVQRVANSVYAMKVPFILFDCTIMLLLLQMLKTYGLPRRNVLYYAWNPLVLVEISASGHNDSLPVFLLLGALFLLGMNKPWRGALIINAALASKYLAVLFLPAVWRRVKSGAWVLLPVSLLLFYAPFYGGLGHHILSLSTVGANWRFNDSIFAVIHFLTGSLQLSKLLVAIMFLMVAVFVYRRQWPLLKSAMVLAGAALLLTTTLHPWYLLWIVPFLCFYPNRAWILFTGLVMLSYEVLIQYVAAGIWVENMWIKGVIYTPFYLLLLADGLRSRQSRNAHSVA